MSSGFFKDPVADLAEIHEQFELYSARLEELYLLSSQAGDIRAMVATLAESRKFLEKRLDRLEEAVANVMTGRRELTVQDFDDIANQLEDVRAGKFTGKRLTVPLLPVQEESSCD